MLQALEYVFINSAPAFQLMGYMQRRAATYGKKVAVVEATGVLGGCCVKVGKCFGRPPKS